MGLPDSSLANLAMWFAKVSRMYGIGIRGQQENYKFLTQMPEKAMRAIPACPQIRKSELLNYRNIPIVRCSQSDTSHAAQRTKP